MILLSIFTAFFDLNTLYNTRFCASTINDKEFHLCFDTYNVYSYLQNQ